MKDPKHVDEYPLYDDGKLIAWIRPSELELLSIWSRGPNDGEIEHYIYRGRIPVRTERDPRSWFDVFHTVSFEEAINWLSFLNEPIPAALKEAWQASRSPERNTEPSPPNPATRDTVSAHDACKQSVDPQNAEFWPVRKNEFGSREVIEWLDSTSLRELCSGEELFAINSDAVFTPTLYACPNGRLLYAYCDGHSSRELYLLDSFDDAVNWLDRFNLPLPSGMKDFWRPSPDVNQVTPSENELTPSEPDGPIPPSSFQWRGERTKKLSKTEYKLLAYIFERRANPPTVGELKKQFWPKSYDDRGSYDRFATGLRKKLNPIGATIDTDNGHVVISPLSSSDPE